MTKRKLLTLNLLSIYTLIMMAGIINSYNVKTLLSFFLLSLPVVFIYMKIYVKMLSTTFFFIIFYLMLFYIQPIYNLLIEYHYTQYNMESIKVLTFLSVLGLLLFCIGNCVLTEEDWEFTKVYIEFTSIKKAVYFISSITIISLILIFIDIGTFNIMSLSRLSLKTGSIFHTFATYGFYTTSIMFFLISFTSKVRSKLNITFWIIIFVVFEILIFMLYRTRSLLVVHSAAIIVGYYYSNLYGYNLKRNKISPKIITIILSVVVFVLAISSRFIRGALQPGGNIVDLNFDLEIYLRESIMNGDIGYSSLVLDVINYVDKNKSFLFGQSYYRLLFIFIPRFLWPDKPLSSQRIVATWLEPGVEGLTLPPGIIGDTYINFGIFGIFLLVIFGMLFAHLDNDITINNFMLWSVSATWIFHLVRGGFTNPLLIFFVLSIVLKFIYKKFFYNVYTYPLTIRDQ